MTNHKLHLCFLLVACFAVFFFGCDNASHKKTLKFSVSIADSLLTDSLSGRVLVMLAKNNKQEPRFQISTGPSTQIIFGADAESFKNGEIVIDNQTLGYPYRSLDEVPAGEYYVQGLLHTYETFHLANGKTVKLPMDNGEGQQWNRSPGNIFSTPVKVKIDPSSGETVNIQLDQVIPPIPEPEDSKYIKHIKIKSELLSKFWGRPMYVGAHVLLPEGFDEHPDARYPISIFHGHYPSDFGGFRTEPADENMEPEYSERFRLEGYNKIQQEEAYDFYKTWTGPDFPRMLIVEIQHANPYYDDSYAVNSENIGPYGDAITYELIPYIEKQFQGIGEGWARFLYGGSTGGWEALAVQVLYPDEYNGCFAACPDPIDFRAYTVVDIYKDSNAYYLDSDFKKTPRPGMRDYQGHISCTLEEMNQLENVLGTNSRSGGQWDIWQAVYSPNGEDGYPKPIWDKATGEIDPEVAAFWKENFDLHHILERDWDKLGPKLKGKIHIYCGDMDNYYLNNAVKLMEAFLEDTKNPYYDGEVAYGDGFEHCWNGDPDLPNAISRLRYNTMYVPKILDRIKTAAPANADLTSWRY